MSTDETVLAYTALTVLGGPRYCDETEEPLDPVTGQCGFGYHTHCPFCGEWGGQDCPHMLATWDSERGYEGPRLPMPPADCELLADCSAERKKQALGEFLPLSAVYEEYADSGSHPVGSFRHQLNENWLSNELLEWIVAHVPGIRVASWEPSGPGGAYGNVCYAARPDQVRAGMAAINERVLRAFEALLHNES